MKLKKLLRNYPDYIVKGSREVEITGLCSDSRCVSPGNLFVAKRGINNDGAQFIPEAVNAGAAAILTDLYDPSLRNIPQILASNVQKAEANLAAEYYMHPDKELFLIGVTGTNGKTTSTYMAKQLLDMLNSPCGLIGTIECIIGETRYRSSLTTPDILTNYKLMREMVAKGCKAAAMEVSSHGLEMDRVENINFDTGIFTNLSPEHLDYHLTMDSYAQAKRKLFEQLGKSEKNSAAVINWDDAYAPFMAEKCDVPVLSYGVFSRSDLQARDIKFRISGIEGCLVHKNTQAPFYLPLLGMHNIYNFLAAAAACLTAGYSIEEIASLAKELKPVRGRLEQVSNLLGLQIFVDFAHKDVALRTVLEALRASCKGRVITVFGCGGNRDRLKRPRMARVSEELSDITIVTSDNPRNEPPEQIIQEILTGFSSLDNVIVQVDRRQAIAQAIELAGPEDVILIAGKGHEDQQIFAHTTIPFDDRLVAREICEAKALNTPASK